MDEKLNEFGLGGNPKLSILTFSSEGDWLELRRKGIGGSDAGAILGLNKYTSPMMVYKAKVDDVSTDLSDNPNVKRGKDLEDVILTKYVQPRFKEYGYDVAKPDFMIVNSDYPFLRANVDGIARTRFDPECETSILIEIKCVSMFAEDAWDGPEYCGVPPYYYAQVQHYLAVTGMRKAYLVALFDRTWSVKWYPILWDQKFIDDMLPKLKAFYENNMLMGIPPMVSYKLDKEDATKAISSAPKPTVPDDYMASLVEEYKFLSDEIKERERDRDHDLDLILDLYRQGHYPTKGTVKFSTSTRHSFNQTKFKEAYPDLYEQFCEDVQSTRTTIK